ncbi:hypothetical protein A4R43_35480 [Amycolatopsis albispora]|uniref:Uncharacterized protein n=2 Tax=Amycolatopsis albispora TaxID=1804986 RepID=A0A344LGC1_9PSEU|nr:hypothetical protein A4R43_35480 [Amycolatopsis albispora]
MMVSTHPAPPVVGQFQFAFARAWLFKQGIHAEPSWFIAMRLAGREHARSHEFARRYPAVLILYAAMMLGVPATLAMVGVRLPDAGYVLLCCVLPFAVTAWFNHLRVVGERRVAATLPRRVARVVAPKWTDFLNGWLVCALVLTYLGGLGLAAGLIALGEVPAGGVLAAVVLLGGGVMTWQTRRALNRPALAVDALTLLVDDRLRAEEVRGAALPVAAYAFLAPMLLTDLVSVRVTLFGLCVASLVCWVVSGRGAKHRGSVG